MVEGWGGGGCTHYVGGLPGLYLTLTSITVKGFTNVSVIMDCLQVICGYLVGFRVI